MDNKDRLRFAVTFVGQDLDRLRPGDLSNWNHELWGFLGWEKGVSRHPPAAEPIVLPSPLEDPYPLAKMKELQMETRLILSGLIDHREGRSAKPLFTSVGPVAIAIRSSRGSPDQSVQYVRGPKRDIFLHRLFFLLGQEPNSSIQRCPECDSIFYRVRRQKYCKRECTTRAFWRSYPAEAKERARRKRYAKQGWTYGARKGKKKSGS